MKTNQILAGLVVIVLLALSYNNGFAQTSIVADTIKNTCGEEGSSDILFRLCDSTILQLSSEDNGKVRINTNLEVPNGYVRMDSIRSRVIHVGDSSIVIGTPQNAIPGSNNLYTNNGSLRIQSNAANNFSTIINAGISAGVGIGNSFPQEKLQIHQDDIGGVHQSVYTLFTNELNGYSISPLPGFKVGISSGLNGEIRQERNLPLNFFTDNIQHVTVLANGNVGIGDFFTVEPKKRLDIFDSTDAQLIYSISKIFLTGTSNALAIS